jgi:hypothetical protein
MTQVLNRLRGMTRDEVSWRARAAKRTVADRIAVRLRRPAWQRDHIRRVLAAHVVNQRLEEAIAAGRWNAVHDRLALHIRGRESRFALDPASSAELIDEVGRGWPAAGAQAAKRADAVLAGRYDLLGYRGLTFTGADGRVDWHLDPVHRTRAPLHFWADVPFLDPAIGDHKIVWELNRHQHWLPLGRALWLTGDARYGQRMLDELEGWLAANPPLMGINWASMLELGFRSMSWIWGLHFLLGSPIPAPGSPIANPWLVDMFVALDRQLTHIEQNLSVYFSPNTHLTGEALALYVGGVALPELAASPRWRDTGRRILLDEIDRQILKDGGHVERSTHYHRYTLDFYLMALITARRDGDAAAGERFTNAAIRLAEFARTIADDAGRFPLIGDDDGGMLWPFAGRECQDMRDSLAVAAVLLERPDLAPWGIQEETRWILGAPEGGNSRRTGDVRTVDVQRDVQRDVVSGFSRTIQIPSRLFAETGYAVLRGSDGSHAVFDVGDHGYMNGGHAHADALSMTLSLAGCPLLVDPGTAVYTANPQLRDRFRGSTSHNTLTIDKQPQARPGGPFRWRTRANATLHGWRSHPHLDWAEGSHDAYAPVVHRRSVLRTTGSGWLVIDEVLGAGAHAADAHWHVAPTWSLVADAPGRVRVAHADEGEAWMLYDAGNLFLAHGDEASGLGWYAPAYGAVVPAWTARITRTCDAPFAMLTWIGTTQPGTGPPSMERLTAACEANDVTVAASVRTGDRTSVFLVCPSGADSHHGCACDIGAYQTDARVFHGIEDAGSLTEFNLIDGTQVLARGGDGISACSSMPMPYLHATMKDGVLDLEASQPPVQLRLDIGPMRRVVSIRLNRRELPVPADHRGTFLIYGADWSGPVRDLLTSTA